MCKVTNFAPHGQISLLNYIKNLRIYLLNYAKCHNFAHQNNYEYGYYY